MLEPRFVRQHHLRRAFNVRQRYWIPFTATIPSLYHLDVHFLLRENIHFFCLVCLWCYLNVVWLHCWFCFIINLISRRRFLLCLSCVSGDKSLWTGNNGRCLSKPLTCFRPDVTLSFHVINASFNTRTQTSEIVTDFNNYLCEKMESGLGWLEKREI